MLYIFIFPLTLIVSFLDAFLQCLLVYSAAAVIIFSHFFVVFKGLYPHIIGIFYLFIIFLNRLAFNFFSF